MDENEIMHALGLEAEKTAEAADRQEDQQTTPEGEKDAPDENAGPDDGQPEGQQQSKEERAQNAARRRQQELEKVRSEAYAAGRKDARDEISGTLKKIGTPDPTRPGETINSAEDLENYRDKLGSQRLAKAIRNGGAEAQDALTEAIDNHPIVRKAAELLKKQEQEQADAAESAFREQVDRELESIREYDPEIVDQDTLLRKEGDEFRRAVRMGMSFIEAYEFVHRKEIGSNKRAAEGQRKADAAKSESKSHLQPVKQRGSGAQTVPPEVMALYREMNPEASEAEIIKHYNTNHKKDE